MAAIEQELITLIPGTMPRTADDPLIYIDVASRSLRMVHDGTIIPLITMSRTHQTIFDRAIDRLISDATHPPRPRRARNSAKGETDSQTRARGG